jgi:hypothetical protein
MLHGLVEYSGPFIIIRPVDATRGNLATLMEAANRGRTEMDGSSFETEDGLDLMSPDGVKTLTDPTFFRLGYSLTWVGWQGRLGPVEFGLHRGGSVCLHSLAGPLSGSPAVDHAAARSGWLKYIWSGVLQPRLE